MKQCRRAGFAQQMSSFLSRQRVRRFERGDEWGKKLGGGQKKGEKVLLIANRTQAVVSLTVYDVLYIYMYMHSAMWPVDSSSSSSSLFFSFPLLYRLFHKKQPSASSSSAVASKRGNDISVYVRSTTEAEPRLAPDKQVVPSVFLHPSMFFLRHHSYANRASSYYPLFSFFFSS